MTRPHILLALTLLLTTPLLAQSTTHTPTTIPALFLSDIHLDPFADPAKVARLNVSPIAQWPAILTAPVSPTQPQDSAALSKACPTRGVDTPNVLWQSSLHAIHAHAAGVRFVTVSGDLLAHSFDCKYKTLLPAAAHADYLAFTEKTAAYIVTGLRATLPGVPVYIALGNNDSACGDYRLDPAHDDLLARLAPIVADAAGLPDADRASLLQDFATGGYYSVPLANTPNARLIVLDDIYLSAKYAACSGTPDPAPGLAQLAWLDAQLDTARQRNEHVWVMAHIPPGVDLISTARKLATLCGGEQLQMFLGSESLAELLANYPSTVRLALFGHTHTDEMHLLTSSTDAKPGEGVPLKIVASITPINGNRPTFTVARVNPATAALADYTVFEASNLTGIATTWSAEYTYSTAFHQPAFNAAAVSTLIADFQSDPSAQTSASQSYLRNYFPGAGNLAILLQTVWPQYTCSMAHDSAAAFTACACSTK
jgi:sphingomyelin phosphodiesterase acid-like 3